MHVLFVQGLYLERRCSLDEVWISDIGHWRLFYVSQWVKKRTGLLSLKRNRVNHEGIDFLVVFVGQPGSENWEYMYVDLQSQLLRLTTRKIVGHWWNSCTYLQGNTAQLKEEWLLLSVAVVLFVMKDTAPNPFKYGWPRGSHPAKRPCSGQDFFHQQQAAAVRLGHNLTGGNLAPWPDSGYGSW